MSLRDSPRSTSRWRATGGTTSSRTPWCSGSASSSTSSTAGAEPVETLLADLFGGLPWWGVVLLVLAVVVVAWEPSRVAIQTAVLLPNLLDAGPKPLNLVTEAPQRTSVTYRVAEPGADPDLAELWLPSWASAERR